MISILNYGMGNIRSVQNALNFLKIESKVIKTPDEILRSEKLILPGVGSFKKAMENIKNKRLLDPLNEIAIDKNVPILGICLGMQLMAEKSEEAGITEGLGWVKGASKKFSSHDLNIKVPHVGFNTVVFEKNNKSLYNGLDNQADFYYVHSYRISYNDCDAASGWTNYGDKFVASIEKNNIFGTQYHPEKSQSNGLILLKNFSQI